MRILKTLVLTGFLALCPQAFGQDEGYFGGITRWNTKPVEPGTIDSLKKLNAELAELKARLKILEDNQSNFNVSLKTQFQSMNDSLKSMQAHCDKLQTESTSYKTGLVQTGAVVPMAKQEAVPPLASHDQMNKRHDELSLQVQANMRELAELKNKLGVHDKKIETQERDVIQAQNDIGKLQQDLARMNIRPSASDDTSGGRKSLYMPLPPDSQGTNQPRTAQSSIKLVNTYPTPITIIVDGQFYTLPSNNSLSVNHAPGYFTYEVPGIQANTVRTLGTAETMTIQIYPR